MLQTYRIRLVTCGENFNAAMVSVGVFFYAQNLLHFGDWENLWLGLGMGTSVVIGALLSHPISKYLAARTQVLSVLGTSMLLHVLIGLWPSVWLVVVGSILLNFLNGIKWPIIESYVTAGLTQKETNKALGWFNISWSGGVMLAIACSGKVIEFSSGGLFLLPALINVVSLILTSGLDRNFVSLAEDHPDRPDEMKLQYLSKLVTSSRWGLMLAFLLGSILNPLLPGIFDRMHFSVSMATLLSSVVYIGRWGTFVLLAFWSGWHDRVWPLAWMLILLPVSFLLILTEHDVVTVVSCGFVLGGLQAVAYFAALYYAMIVKNAAVDAGGHHEATVGMGLVAGPVTALLGQSLSAPMGSAALGMWGGVGPVVVGLMSAGLWPICVKRLSRQTS